MKTLAASIVIAPLLLAGVLLPVASPSIASDTPSQTADDGAPSSDVTGTRMAGEEIHEWQQKLHDIRDRAEAKATDASNAAETYLDRAWSKTEETSGKLRTLGAEGWEKAKTSFERASRELADAWDHLRFGDK
jgi:hypothetical protein